MNTVLSSWPVLLEVVAKAADVLVGVVEHAGKHGHLLRVEVLLRLAQAGPVSGQHGLGQLEARGHQAHLHLALVALRADHRPARLIAGLVLVDVHVRRLQRRVHGLEGDDAEEGLAARPAVLDVADHLVDIVPVREEVLRQLGALAVFPPDGLQVQRGIDLGLVVVGTGLLQREVTVPAACAG
jgi:hypothetical protein